MQGKLLLIVRLVTFLVKIQTFIENLGSYVECSTSMMEMYRTSVGDGPTSAKNDRITSRLVYLFLHTKGKIARLTEAPLLNH